MERRPHERTEGLVAVSSDAWWSVSVDRRDRRCQSLGAESPSLTERTSVGVDVHHRFVSGQRLDPAAAVGVKLVTTSGTVRRATRTRPVAASYIRTLPLSPSSDVRCSEDVAENAEPRWAVPEHDDQSASENLPAYDADHGSRRLATRLPSDRSRSRLSRRTCGGCRSARVTCLAR